MWRGRWAGTPERDGSIPAPSPVWGRVAYLPAGEIITPQADARTAEWV